MMAARLRLDRLLADRQLVSSREKAHALVLSGRVRVNGQPVQKAGTLVRREASLEVLPAPFSHVSRGGAKLEAALAAFGVNPAGWTVLDVGASTGGFTDALLQHGAERVIALDVGHGQLDWTLRRDPRVVVVERFNARFLSPERLETAVRGRVRSTGLDLAVIDVSFISLSHILPAVASLPSLTRCIPLVKPQFEAGRKQVGKGGVVRDPQVHAAVVETVCGQAALAGWRTRGILPSPLAGTKGNREFFLHLVRENQATGRVGQDP
ncbi:MAG: TlyA family RNA methyltransferase [Acidobacteriota bacterium]